ncbi:digeranylgeranylglyceryl phosphate synthase [Methanocalculus chunghsingensis]|uniref:Digeranylgeranylglyceryl phosphate synthase n=1 Tax=Methanocalculus chunghsingensis TaxID=156457 RepID=A0A8J7WA42_9EURY|nr:geranylgeranylglycerol-phosphate geranylgeranyltransferase [Methanocalculus chunghsingensis]MBR1368917.1 digeranylgeranylglyceryl phosphate synthase [Methanocalculus chunghsingensis]
MHLPGFIRITRPANCLVAGGAAIIAYFIAAGSFIPETLFLFVTVLLITAAGNTINDAYDAAIDAINRPDRPIPSGEMTVRTAQQYSLLLFIGGIGAALFTNSICLSIAVFNTLILFFYARSLKKAMLIGNIAVAYLSGSIFLFGGALAGIEGLIITLPLVAITFFGTVAREILKDAEDIDGDALGGATTFPMVAGLQRSVTVAFGCAIIAVMASLIPVLWWGLPYLVGILVLDGAILKSVYSVRRCSTPACVRDLRVTKQLAYLMYAALLIFALAAGMEIFIPID